jgi:intracellular septation protein
MTASGADESGKPGQGVKLALELGPVAVFVAANFLFGIYTATGVLMAASVIAVAASWALLRKVPVMPCVTAVVVLIFGGLTLALEDELFIKLKPTIVNLLFAAIVLGTQAIGRPAIKIVFGEAFEINEAGWRKLSIRWGLYFIAMAILNEIVWRNFSTDFWVAFKLWGFTPLGFIFGFAQVPLIRRHWIGKGDPPAAEEVITAEAGVAEKPNE